MARVDSILELVARAVRQRPAQRNDHHRRQRRNRTRLTAGSSEKRYIARARRGQAPSADHHRHPGLLRGAGVAEPRLGCSDPAAMRPLTLRPKVGTDAGRSESARGGRWWRRSRYNGNGIGVGSSILVEVMSMNGKLWSEAREIAGRHGRGDGDDLAQDLIVAALERGAAAENPGAWLERVGRNAAIDRWRVQRRRDELATEIDLPASPIDPEAALLCRERRGLVRRALAALPRPQRRAALARFHADLPFEEVAARVGAPAITARTRVHRALASLRVRLGGLRAMFVFPGVQMSALMLPPCDALPAISHKSILFCRRFVRLSAKVWPEKRCFSDNS